MARNQNPADVAAKWLSGMQNSTANYKAGVMAQTVSPTELAAQNKDKYIAGVNEAYNSGRYEQGLRRVSLSDWQKAASDVGAQRLASGAQGARSKVTQFLSAFLPAVSSAQSTVNAMPSNTYEARKAKANAMMDALHSLKGKFKQ